MKILFFLLATICSLVPFFSHADHAGGGYFQYTCLSNNLYQVDYYFLRDCGGIPAYSALDFYLGDNCGGTCSSIATAPKVSTTPVDFGCGNACNGGGTQAGAPSYELVKYSANITLGANCEEWIVSTSVSARNAVDYIDNSTGPTSMYNFCIINNANGNCTSSVGITGIPFGIGCVNGLGSSLYNIQNTNGNQLNFELKTPLNGNCSNSSGVNYIGGTDKDMPIPSVSDFVVDQSNGQFDYAPTGTGQSYFALEIEELDANNNRVGLIRLDGIVFASNSCQNEPISFSYWTTSGSNTFEAPLTDQTYCSSFNVTPVDPNVSLTEVIVELDSYVTLSNITYNPDGSATVEVCALFPAELECLDVSQEITVVAKAPGNDCIGLNSGSGDIQTYTITKPPTPYCPEHLFFTNRNSVTGIPMPNFAQAEQTIWVGDDMPIFAPPEIEGPVELIGNLELRAGNQIVLPSCQGGGTGCVTITGITTLVIEDVNCSPECLTTPISVSCDKKFFCYGEQLTANIVDGTPPYTIVWNVNGTPYTNTSYQNYNVLDIYQIAANNEGNIPYSVTVFDATSQEVTCSGSFLGTKRFYNDIRQNTEYINYPGSMALEDGYYYNAYTVISTASQTEAIIYDGVNYNPNIPIDEPPYYGATAMDMTIWDRWGDEVVFEKSESIEGGSDWSIDNFSFRWNGHLNNDENEPCLGPSGTFNYRLIARNCLSNTIPIPPVQSPLPPPEEAHIENSIFGINDGCYSDPTIPIISAGRESNQGYPVFTLRKYTNNRGNETDESFIVDNEIYCQPNPTTGEFTLNGGILREYNVQVIGINGKSIRLNSYQMGTEINISELSNGVYTIIVRSEHDFVQMLKLVKL